MALEVPAGSAGSHVSVPYAASWLDRLQVRLDRGPLSPWMVYAVVWLVPFAAVTAVLWATDAHPVGTFSLFHATLWGTAVFALALMHHLDRCATTSLQAFRPALSVRDEEYALLLYRLTHLPAGTARAVALVGIALGVAELATLPADAVAGLGLFSSTAARAIEALMYVVGWVFFTALVYHTVHQLRVVDHIYRSCTKVNLFRLDPIYSFSWLTARTALGVALLPYAYFLVASILHPRAVEPQYLVVVFGSMAVAAVVFAWPLRGVHAILAREKVALLREASIRLEAAIHDLHRYADAKDYAVMDGLNKLISSLTLEQAALERISTWPWKPDTGRLFATALVLPLLAFLAQRALSSAMGF